MKLVTGDFLEAEGTCGTGYFVTEVVEKTKEKAAVTGVKTRKGNEGPDSFLADVWRLSFNSARNREGEVVFISFLCDIDL